MNNLSALDLLSIVTAILQVETYEQELRTASNDDIAKHLARQDTEYLEKIIRNQELIIDLLGAGKPAPDGR